MRIAFTSCINRDHSRDQPIWTTIAGENPDYLFLLGDQIYMDFFPNLGEPAKWSSAKFEREMRARYETQWAEPNFKSLIERMRARRGDGGVYGVWDDHDFAWNNAYGLRVPDEKKQIARSLFAEFVLGGAALSGEGIEQAITLRDGGHDVGKAIFLDARTYRDFPGEGSPFLGDEQYAFLEREIAHDLPLTILCCGTPQRATGKGWTRYGSDYRRFLRVIGNRKAILLTGDIHENAFIPPAAGTSLYEIVASGAAVRKLLVTGVRRNYGLLDWSPERIDVKLVDKRQAVSYTIWNDDFRCTENEPGQD